MSEKKDIDKLRILLPHWLEHSKSHQQEFHEWAQRVRQEGHTEIAELISKALAAMHETDKLLNEALDKAGGAEHGHHHHHHH